MTHELLGSHKPSAEWYTPEDIWQRVEKTFGTSHLFDPCPAGGLASGFCGLKDLDWEAGDCKNLYVNPPTPAAPWAIKAIQTHLAHPEVNIIFAAFSEAVLWQVNDLMDFPVCWVRNRISWIDGNQWVKMTAKEQSELSLHKLNECKGLKPNPNYLKPAKSPRNYNAMVCLSNDKDIIRRFCESFENLGTIRQSFDMSIG